MIQNNLLRNPIFYIFSLCLLVFILSLFIEGDVYYYLALASDGWTSEPWTLLTSIFVHNGIFHFLINMVALYFLGTYLLRMIGWKRFLIVYFLAGLAGSLLFVLLAPTNVAVVGASGAIFGLGGALAILNPVSKVMIIPIPVPMPIWVAVLAMFVITSLIPNTAWECHLGGLLMGVAIGLFMRLVTFKHYYHNRRFFS